MVIDLSEAGLDIIGMQDHIIIVIGYLEVICLDGDVVKHEAELAVEFQTVGYGCHGTKGNGAPDVFL